MIKNIYSGSPSVYVGGQQNPPIYNTGGSMVGQLRYNPSTSNYEIYDGNVWQTIYNSIPVGLNQEAEDAIRWARDRMREEQDLKQRMEQHPGLKDAYEKFQIMDIMTREEDEQRAS
jgi:hypothetical protein